MVTFVKVKQVKNVMTMKKRSLLFVVLAVFAIAAQAQLLWKISGNGLARPSYVLGTHHFAPSSFLDEIPGMQQAFDGCDVVIGEMDMEASMSFDSQMAIAQALMAPPDSTLDKLYSPEDYKIIEEAFNKYCGSLGIPFSMMNRLKPAGISMQMQAVMSAENMPDFIENDAIDFAVQKRGKKIGRPAMGFETVEEQIGFIVSKPIARQAEDLLESCKKGDAMVDELSMLTGAYMSQDLSKIETVFNDPEINSMDAGDLDVLINNRNRNWIEKLVPMMPERACLVCVGAGHLFGDKGLLQLLRDRGYTVEPMQ